MFGCAGLSDGSICISGQQKGQLLNTAFNLPIGVWDVSAVTIVRYMFWPNFTSC